MAKSLKTVKAKVKGLGYQINFAFHRLKSTRTGKEKKEHFPLQSLSGSRVLDYNAAVTSVVTSLMKGKIALTLVADEAKSKHSAKKPCLLG